MKSPQLNLVTLRIRLLTMGCRCVYRHALTVEIGSVACALAHMAKVYVAVLVCGLDSVAIHFGYSQSVTS